jgi:hypothetical protein
MSLTSIIAGLLLVSGVLDYLVTRHGLRLGLLEANPIMRWAQARFGRRWGVFKIGLHLIAAIIILQVNEPIVTVIGGIALVTMIAVILSNLYQTWGIR